MKIHRNKHFNTIIITKKSILIFVCLIVLSIVITVMVFKRNDTNTQYASGDDFYSLLLSSQLHTDNSDFLSKISEALLGFDFDKPETLLTNYTDTVKRNYDYLQKDMTLPEQAPVQTPAPTPVPVEDITIAKGLSLSNSTNLNIDTNNLINSSLGYTLECNSPEVLIVHTHTTESFTDNEQAKYTATSSDRSTDETKNMIAVGNILADVLTQRGISVIHDTTVHDYPSYNGAYNRSKATVLSNLEKYPSIKLVLDLHRDGIVRSDGTKVKVSCEINGEKTAQCMFVVGTNVSLTHDNWQENMKLACKLQNKANELYPNLMRPINVREERFNQQLSTGAIIIEVGSNGNTLNEAKNGAKYIGNVIASLFGK